LIPTLQPGDIVIIDNLGSHKGKAVRRAIRAAGARLFYLPKYSPDLNPIEQFFAKLKHGFARLQSAPPTPSSMQSNRSSTPSHPPSAQTTSKTRGARDEFILAATAQNFEKWPSRFRCLP